MLAQLTPEQQFELMHYASIEPFGEMRADYRMAALLKQGYDIARGKKGRAMGLGEFVLYKDVVESAAKHKTTESLVAALDALAAKPKARKKRGR